MISGSGNVALHAAEKCLRLGGKVIALSDSKGSIHDPAGLTEEKLAWIKDLKEVRRGRIKEYADTFDGVTFREGQDPWDLACDLAFPCATQRGLVELKLQRWWPMVAWPWRRVPTYPARPKRSRLSRRPA